MEVVINLLTLLASQRALLCDPSIVTPQSIITINNNKQMRFADIASFDLTLIGISKD